MSTSLKKFLNERESTFNSAIGVVTPRGCIYTEKKEYQFGKKILVIFWQKLKKISNSKGKWERNKTTAPRCIEYK